MIDLTAIDGALVSALGIPRFVAGPVLAWLASNVAESDRAASFDALVRQWLLRLEPALGPRFSTIETPRVILISDLEPDDAALLSVSADLSAQRVCGLLGIEDGEQVIVIAFAAEDAYYDYIAYHYPDDGEYPRSGGICLGENTVVHVALAPMRELLMLEAVAAHEIGHALLGVEHAPLWVQEGIAQISEERIVPPFDPPDAEQAARLRALARTSEFRSGESFSALDDRGLLSYEAALLLLKTLVLRDPDSFRGFVRDAEYDDGGDAALRAHYGIGFEDLLN